MIHTREIEVFFGDDGSMWQSCLSSEPLQPLDEFLVSVTEADQQMINSQEQDDQEN